ncbi:hypothetical protein OXV27_23640 [Burkholderia contaminans]|nr:hypothetical protein [Burkholderia contaminans]MEB4633823.1 hypothetical protein [Burkholderia contaminans]MEB4638280.1 hypothetical protein [Burkholderia contaminans]MEB4654880.1 hypothetical protein [Burkholderia contaminans]MEB4663216.1 hypothetical protein [Burkholderia contaminans]MEB4671824.1 hypothetical protein [Burkholderia contaminans]
MNPIVCYAEIEQIRSDSIRPSTGDRNCVALMLVGISVDHDGTIVGRTVPNGHQQAGERNPVSIRNGHDAEVELTCVLQGKAASKHDA